MADTAEFRKQLKTHLFTLAFNVHWLLNGIVCFSGLL